MAALQLIHFISSVHELLRALVLRSLHLVLADFAVGGDVHTHDFLGKYWLYMGGSTGDFKQ